MITLVNYGVGNIKAVASAIKQAGGELVIANTKDQLTEAKKIILPGVGSFGNAMQNLNKSGMRDILEKLVVEKKIPILGICVGMQMLTNSSTESELKGLGWIDAHVSKFETKSEKLILPHMGYNSVEPSGITNPLLLNLPQNPMFYFLHNYHVHCNNPIHVSATTKYQEVFPSIITHENIYGVQFHPEKSHSNGIELFKNFNKT